MKRILFLLIVSLFVANCWQPSDKKENNEATQANDIKENPKEDFGEEEMSKQSNDTIITPKDVEVNEDGTISWKNGFEEKFFKKRYENEMCLSCKYLPICMGVCARNYEDDSYFYCKHSDPSVDIRKSIINYINYSL